MSENQNPAPENKSSKNITFQKVLAALGSIISLVLFLQKNFDIDPMKTLIIVVIAIVIISVLVTYLDDKYIILIFSLAIIFALYYSFAPPKITIVYSKQVIDNPYHKRVIEQLKDKKGVSIKDGPNDLVTNIKVNQYFEEHPSKDIVIWQYSTNRKIMVSINLKQSEEVFSEAIALNQLLLFLENYGQWDQIKSYLKVFLEKDWPELRRITVNVDDNLIAKWLNCKALYGMKKLDNCIKCYTDLREMVDKDHLLHYDASVKLGSLLCNSNNKKQAIEIFTDCVRNNSESSLCWVNLILLSDHSQNEFSEICNEFIKKFDSNQYLSEYQRLCIEAVKVHYAYHRGGCLEAKPLFKRYFKDNDAYIDSEDDKILKTLLQRYLDECEQPVK